MEGGKLGRLGLRTREKYQKILDRHVLPRFGKRKVSSLDDADVVALIGALEDEGTCPLDDPRRTGYRSRASWLRSRAALFGRELVWRLNRDDGPPAETAAAEAHSRNPRKSRPYSPTHRLIAIGPCSPPRSERACGSRNSWPNLGPSGFRACFHPD